MAGVGRARSGVLASVVVAAVVLAALAVSPAEARRRSLAEGGGYNPPYADMIVDASTGKVLHAVNANALRHPASVTKVMTLFLLFEHIEKGRLTLESELPVSARAQAQAPSKLGLKAGDTITVDDAIKALVIKSANDVAVVVAETIGGTEDAFAAMMTRKARQLGMSRTVYKNASGLPDPGQVTTARDLVTLGRALQDRFPRYYSYFRTPSFLYAGVVHRNHNRLLGQVDGMDGIKTGYTRMSGFNLLTSVKADGRHVVGVILGGRTAAARDEQMEALLEEAVGRAHAGTRTASAVGDGAAPQDDTVAATAALAGPMTKGEAAAAPVRVASMGPIAIARPAAPPPAPPVAAAPASPALKWSVGPPAKLETKTVASAERKTAKVEPNAKPEPKAPTGPKSALAGWIVQVGATDEESKARQILHDARAKAKMLAEADMVTERVATKGSVLYRARFSGLTESNATTACKQLQRSGMSCFAVRGG